MFYFGCPDLPDALFFKLLIIMYSKKSNPVVFARTGEKQVINPHLASTPSQLYDQLVQGKPLGQMQDEGNYFEGTEDVGFSIPVAFKRGVDMADAWEASMDARQARSKVSSLISQQNIQSTEQIKTK